MTAITNRYEFVLLFDVENGNPNGDPDAGNLPRIDPETSHGLITDVCLKRKVRNYVELAKKDKPGYNIYVQEKAVLNQRHALSYKALGLDPDKKNKRLPKEEADALRVTGWMRANYYDVRTFGAVMSTEVNCGQVRGPVQFNFARSIDPIVPLEISITRMAVTNEADLEKERTMGRKHIVPYALYRAEGYVSPGLADYPKMRQAMKDAPQPDVQAMADNVEFSDADLELLWEALLNMFDHDHSAARGKMTTRRLIVFRHDGELGSVPAHVLFDRVRVTRKLPEGTPARQFEDYEVTVGTASQGVEIINKQ